MKDFAELDFCAYWKKSLYVHCAILLLLALSSKFKLFNLFDLEPQKIVPTVRVDIVDLPKYTLEELRKMEVAPPPPSVEDAEVKNKTEEKVEPESEPKQESNIEEVFKKIKKKVEKQRQQDLKKAQQQQKIEDRREEMRQLLLAGNQVKKGSLLEGEEQNQTTTAFEQYILEATERVRLNWKLPSYLKNTLLKCRVQLFINAQGAVQLSKVIESSGNNEYDDWAMKAINESLPFKIPAKEIAPQLLRGKFVLGFPL